MDYIKVVWKHDFENEPVLIYSELDEGRWEARKVEVFRDGSYGYAERGRVHGLTTGLGTVPFPDVMQIASDPEFEAREISKEEFEKFWRAAHEVS